VHEPSSNPPSLANGIRRQPADATVKDKLTDSVALIEGGKGEAKTAKKASGRKRKSASRKKPRAKAQSEARAA
ncbi:MAG: hypothetical protein ACJ8DH_17120, partial [Microvirga sp.]